MLDTSLEFDYQRPVYLHYHLEKFWEIRLDPITFKATIRQGKLMNNGRENILSVQTEELPNKTFKEACHYAEDQIKNRLLNGFERLDISNLKMSKFNIPLSFSVNFPVPNRVDPPENVLERSTSNLNKSKRRPLDVLPRDDMKQSKKGRQEDEEFEDSTTQSTEEKGSGGFFGFFRNWFGGKKKVVTTPRKVIKKNFYISDQLLKELPHLEEELEELGLTYTWNGNNLVVTGEPQDIQDFQNYIENEEEGLKPQKNSTILQNEEEKDKEKNTKKDIILSAFLLTMTDHISKRADRLNVHYTFNDNKVTFLGPAEAVMELLEYLIELEAAPEKQKFDAKYFDELMLSKEMNISRVISDNLNDMKKKMETMELRLKVSSEDALQKEFRLTQAMNEHFSGLKAKVEAIENKRDLETSQLFQDGNRRNNSLNESLMEMRKKMDGMESKLNANKGGLNSKESEVIQSMNNVLTELKNKVGSLELKMEVDTDEIMQEDFKLHKTLTDNLGLLSKKLDAVDLKVDINSGEFVQKELRMKGIHDTLAEVSKKVNELELKIDTNNKKGANHDFEKKLDELIKLVDKKLSNNPSSNNETKPNENKKQEQEEDYIQREMGISVFQRDCQKDIEKKAEELQLICDFGYDFIQVTGYPKNVEKFMLYLQECEIKVKKGLYPKYWNFFETRTFSIIPVSANSEEYREISNLFKNYLALRPIVKIERIQNKYLMEQYITNIQKRKEYQFNQHLPRKLLFYRSGNTNPEAIYKDSDVGFDLQFADNLGYGKGLYFYTQAGNNINFQKNAYITSSGNSQVLIADVLVGNSKIYNEAGKSYSKAPDGYDSVNYNGNTYAIFNNFHSCPLYLVEYQ